MRRLVLHVAEKPSIANTVTNFLKHGESKKERSSSQYNPIFIFSRKFMTDEQAVNKVTSVTGHITELEFDAMYKDWNKHDPSILISSAKIYKTYSSDKSGIVENLRRLSREATDLVLWLDCDREGENIAYEVIGVCSQENPRLVLHRARFSAATKADIERAFNNLKKPEKGLSEAVEARQEIDLRIGAAFTRLQTMTMRKEFSQDIMGKVVSYGPCQMPTLGFVVDRYIEIRDFIPEDFWYIQCQVDKTNENFVKPVNFTWERNRFYDKALTELLFKRSQKMSHNIIEITKVKKETRTKHKPLPLTTVKMQKLGTSKLRMTSHNIMSIAEKLYTRGFISYPRTETDQFDKTIDLKRLVSNFLQFPDNSVAEYTNQLVNGGGYQEPRRGRGNDNAHPPIHPVKMPAGLNPEEFKVYNMIARHFLACCSKDAVGESTKVDAMVGDEEFHTSGIIITEKNYLKIYEPFDFWGGTELPRFVEGERLTPLDYSIRQGRTSPPELLTESDLITLMEQNNIGTDSTIHEHIKTIQDRKYAFKQGQVIKPSNLGVSLVECYNSLGIDLAKPLLRAAMEKDMGEIAKGNKTKEEVIIKYQHEMGEIYKKVDMMKRQFVESLAKYITRNSDLNNERADPGEDNDDDGDRPGGDGRGETTSTQIRPRQNAANNDNSSIPRIAGKRIGPCTICGQGSIVVKQSRAGSYFLSCNNYPKCQTSANLPMKIETAEMTEVQCKACSKTYHDSIFKVKMSFEDKSVKSGNFCLMCTDKLVGYKYQLRNKQTTSSTIPQQDIETASMPFPPQASSFTKKEPTCFRCKQIGHYSTNCPDSNTTENVPVTFPSGPTIKKPTMTCSSCGKTGHLTHMCKQMSSTSGRNGPPTDDADNRTMPPTTRNCYRCDQAGHYASNCPTKSTGGGQQPVKKGEYNCFKCGEPGHFSNSCPNR